MNHSSTEPVHFLQMWVPPDTDGIEPGYEQRDVGDQLAAGGLVAVASGRGHAGAVHLHQAGAVLWVARLDAGGTVTVPDAPHAHVFVARGEVAVDGRPLAVGDAARLTAAGPLPLEAATAAEVVIWEC
jgi:hypothetical protein